MAISSYELVALLAPPFIASILFVAIHTNFGLHVLKRGVIFVDLALAQMSALGATIAFAAGHVPTSASGLAYTFLFSAIGAALLTAGRMLSKVIHAEAYIGILYVVATATTIIVVDRSPNGAEHVKQILVGSILAVSVSDLPKFAIVYGAVGVIQWLAHRQLLAASQGAATKHSWNPLLWDFIFYLSFGLVVTSSVATAGILLVFCFLIIPATIGSLFTDRVAGALAIGLFSGTVASATGLAASFEMNLPAGAAMVLAFALVLILAALLRAFVVVPCEVRRTRVRSFFRATAASVLITVACTATWLMIMPRADHPVLDLLESVIGIGPDAFLTSEERFIYVDALNSVRTRRLQATQLTLFERQSRWQGEALSDEDVRRIGTFQQAYNEMARGEDFVLKSLTGIARERERWYVGPSSLIISLLFLLALLPSKWRARFILTTTHLNKAQ